MPELILVDAAACRPLRRAVLRPDQPPRACVYPGDDDERSIHFAVKEADDVLGTASLFHDPRPEGDEVWRMRGLAVLEDWRGKGLGRQLLMAVQAIAKTRGGGLWANVRETARPVYEALGFEVVSDTFDLPPIGPHVVMTWKPAK